MIVESAGIAVETSTDYGRRAFTWNDIVSQSRAQAANRRPNARPAPWMDPAALTRWSVLLRVTGQMLDARGVHSCVIDATVAPPEAPQDCSVEVAVNGKVVLDDEGVRLQILRLRTRFVDARHVAAAGSCRLWWAVWRR